VAVLRRRQGQGLAGHGRHSAQVERPLPMNIAIATAVAMFAFQAG
jgi:hypothetical protein